MRYYDRIIRNRLRSLEERAHRKSGLTTIIAKAAMMVMYELCWNFGLYILFSWPMLKPLVLQPVLVAFCSVLDRPQAKKSERALVDMSNKA